MRLFTAISLPKEFIDEFHYLTNNQKIRGNCNWTKPDNLHITTCFIGETEKNLLDKTSEQVKDITESFSKFRLDFRNIQLAPPKKKPYMIWANYNTNEVYSELCNKLHVELINVHKRSHYPHVTLARFKGFVNFNGNQIRNNFPALEVEHIGLWKSELTPQGPIYEKIEDFQLMV